MIIISDNGLRSYNARPLYDATLEAPNKNVDIIKDGALPFLRASTTPLREFSVGVMVRGKNEGELNRNRERLINDVLKTDRIAYLEEIVWGEFSIESEQTYPTRTREKMRIKGIGYLRAESKDRHYSISGGQTVRINNPYAFDLPITLEVISGNPVVYGLSERESKLKTGDKFSAYGWASLSSSSRPGGFPIIKANTEAVIYVDSGQIKITVPYSGEVL